MALGLAIGAMCWGCNGPGGDYKTAKQIQQEKQAAGKPAHDDHDQDLGAGPHGGAIVELGDDEYHAEIVIDAKSHALRAFLYGPDAKTAAAVAAAEIAIVTEDQKTLKLKAAPQDGDGEGKASKFELIDEASVGQVVSAGFLHGSLQIEVDGKPYRGDVDAHFDGGSHEDHGEHQPAEQKDAPHASETGQTSPSPGK
jgi:hypothetical protein